MDLEKTKFSPFLLFFFKVKDFPKYKTSSQPRCVFTPLKLLRHSDRFLYFIYDHIQVLISGTEENVLAADVEITSWSERKLGTAQRLKFESET